ncbi:MAG: hypothetical protein ACRCSB_03990, partial [Bacteroidales bacterium]
MTRLSSASLTSLGISESSVRLSTILDTAFLNKSQSSYLLNLSPVNNDNPESFGFWHLEKGFFQSYLNTASLVHNYYTSGGVAFNTKKPTDLLTSATFFGETVRASFAGQNNPDNFLLALKDVIGEFQSFLLSDTLSDSLYYSSLLRLARLDSASFFSDVDSALIFPSVIGTQPPDSILVSSEDGVSGDLQAYILQDTLSDSLQHSSLLYLSLMDEDELLAISDGDSALSLSSLASQVHPDSILFEGTSESVLLQSYVLSDTLSDSLVYGSRMLLSREDSVISLPDRDSVLSLASFIGTQHPDRIFVNREGGISGDLQTYILQDSLSDSLHHSSLLYLSLGDEDELLAFSDGDSALSLASLSGQVHPDSILLKGFTTAGFLQSY